MSVLADIYISSDDETIRYDSAPDQFADRAQYNGITPLELSTLWAIVRGIEWEVASMEDFQCLLQQDGGERLIHRLPGAMIADMSGLTSDQIVVVTPKWAA